MSRTVHLTLLLIYLWTLSSCNLNYSASTPIVATSPGVALAIQAPGATATFATAPGSVTDTRPVAATLTNTGGPGIQDAALPSFISDSTIQHQVVQGEWMMQIA